MHMHPLNKVLESEPKTAALKGVQIGFDIETDLNRRRKRTTSFKPSIAEVPYRLRSLPTLDPSVLNAPIYANIIIENKPSPKQEQNLSPRMSPNNESHASRMSVN